MTATTTYATTYLPTTATDYFAACFTDRTNPRATDSVYMAIIPAAEMGNYLTTDRKSSSHGGGEVLRFKPNTTYKVDMRNRYDVVRIATYGEVCDRLDDLKALAANGKLYSATNGKPVKAGALNKGHAIESIICDRWHLTWEFDNASHTECGDITKDGIEYQVKFQGASL